MRRVRKRGGNKEKVFGCDLLEHLNASSQEIPQVLRCCSEFVETHGIVDGIYRLSGVSSNIQKLRGEFESDGSPDLNKDVYLQDIHCVSSLCKAYFRELPNPLLTYQLYDKFAEAVAIQLEEERLVKIGDVLKELPPLHFRTLEFLMRHLVRMASYSSETNMHARNLAIVWAPNLLRSKDIETSGFNGTAAFMEVRVQSIVVEFILTHVPQLFPDLDVSQERRKSLPSPTAASCQEEGLHKSASAQPANYGNISPGDGPLRMTPYHAIIEGTDKRKGSLKGRKWMSIFNIGGRFPDPRRRHKHSTKEKDRPTLRPARSMDSLSSPGYPNEGSRSSSQRPPSTNISKPSPCVTSSPKPGSEVAGGVGVTEYSVTYRRGTGLVSGGAGTQGTYTSLDPDGLVTGNEIQSRSPGMSTKAGRRAAMHITAPNKVTVPLHITSTLVLGVMQGGGADKVIHRGWDKNGADRVESKEGGEKVERRENKGMDAKAEGGKRIEEEEKNHKDEDTVRGGGVDAAKKMAGDEGGEEKSEKKKEGEVREETGSQSELVNRSESTEHLTKHLTSNTEEEHHKEEVMDNKDIEESDEYMDMKVLKPAVSQSKVDQQEDDLKPDASDVLNSTEAEGDDLGLSGYVQDNFEFLDHMDCSGHYQVSEFSVEPPGYSDDEYEVMVQGQSSCHPDVVLRPGSEARTRSVTESTPQRPTSLDIHNRHTKSLSLPYMTSPVTGPGDSSSEEEDGEVELSEDSDMHDYSSEEDDNMFVKSLPLDFILNDFKDSEPRDSCAEHQLQICEEKEPQTLNHESPKKESTATDQEEAVEVKECKEEDGLQEKEIKDKEEQGNIHLEDGQESTVTEEDHSAVEDTPPQISKEQHAPSETSTDCCAENPLLSNDDSSTVPDTTVEQEEVVDSPPCHAGSCVAKKDSSNILQEESRDFYVPEQPISSDEEDTLGREGDEGDDRKEEVFPEMVVNENDRNMSGGTTDEDDEVNIDVKHEEVMEAGDEEQDGVKSGTSNSIWDELEEVVCEVIEDEEERKKTEGKAEGEHITEENDMVQVGEEEQTDEVEEEEMWEADGGENVIEDRVGEVQVKVRDSSEVNQEGEERNSAKIGEPEAAMQEKLIITEKMEKEKESNDKESANEQQRPPTGADVVRADLKKQMDSTKSEETILGGVGRKLVISKSPKVHQAKAVPVVPPKPQHCKITALTLRQQQQQRERREAEERERERETSLRVPVEHFKAPTGERVRNEDEGRARWEKSGLRAGERRKDGDETGARDTSRNSPLSMCFDEAVAIATMRREKEKVGEKDKERQREWGQEVQ